MGGGHTAVDGWFAVGLVKDLKQSIVAARYCSDKDGTIAIDGAHCEFHSRSEEMPDNKNQSSYEKSIILTVKQCHSQYRNDNSSQVIERTPSLIRNDLPNYSSCFRVFANGEVDT